MMNQNTQNFWSHLSRLMTVSTLVALFLVSFSVQSIANSLDNHTPTVHQAPMDVTIDPSGLGMDPFINWLNNNGNANIEPADGCGPASWSNNSSAATWNFTCSQFNGCITILFTYTDACDNETTYPATFCMEDNTPPLCGFPNDLSIDCSDPAAQQVLAAWLTHEIPTDISHPTTTEHDFDFDNINCGETTVVTWTYTDACGNFSTRQAALTISISTPPDLIGVPNGVLLGCNDMVPNPANVTAEDACGNPTNVDFSETTNPNTIIRTWTATDGCGNMSTETQIIILGSDDTPPVLNGVPADANAVCEDVNAAPTVTALDDCDGDMVTVNFSEETTLTDCGETIVRTWTAVDAAGNMASASQTITSVDDTNSPVLNGVPADATINCGDAIPSPANVTATDDCTSVDLQFDETQDGTDCTPSYLIIRTWTATDACGNSTEATQIITVVDTNTEITVTPPDDSTLECDEDIPAATEPIASTTCPDGVLNYDLTEETTDGACEGEYTITRTWTITDNCGNSETVVQTISVVDTTPPVFLFVPGHEDLTCDAYPDGFGEPIIEDNCSDFTMEIVNTFNPYICDADFDISRTWIVTDACGNVSSATQTITIWPDIQDPIFLFVPGDDVIQCPDEAEFGEPEIVDNCLGFTVDVTDEVIVAGSCPEGYTVRRTWTAVDECGNTEVQSQTIQVLPAPSIEFAFVPENETKSCGETFEFGQPVCNSDCLEGFEVTHADEVTLNACGMEVHTRTWTAVDNCGNSASCSQSIEFIDNVAPEFTTVLADKIVGCNDDLQFSEPAAIDLCGGVILTFEDSQEWANCEGIAYSTTRIWTASDACGNASNIAQTIFVEEDTEAPVIEMAPATIEMTFAEFQNWELPTPNVSDNCATIEMANPTATWKTDAVTYTWTAVDACGNSSNVSIKINFEGSIFGDNSAADNQWGFLTPNPATTALTVSFQLDIEADVELEIYDLTGKKWLSQKTAAYTGQNAVELDITILPVGAYFCNLKYNDQEQTMQFLKL